MALAARTALPAKRGAPKAGPPVQLQVCDTPQALELLQGQLAPGLAFGKELTSLWDPDQDPERFVYHGVLAVALARVQGKVSGWGELLVARPQFGEASNSSAFCRISRLDVAPDFRRRSFADPRTGKPLSVLLLGALLKAAPFGAEVVAEVTPDAETLFEEVGFKLGQSGRWVYLGS